MAALMMTLQMSCSVVLNRGWLGDMIIRCFLIYVNLICQAMSVFQLVVCYLQSPKAESAERVVRVAQVASRKLRNKGSLDQIVILYCI